MAISAAGGYDRMKEVREFDESKTGVKGLSDSGVSTIPRIFHHPPESLSGLHTHKTTSSAPSLRIPVIDISNDDTETVARIRDAAKTWGFLQAINHGVPRSILRDTLAAVRSFHDQPPDVKSKLRPPGGVAFSSNNDLYRSSAATWHDSLTVWTAPVAAAAEMIPEICREEVVEWDARVKDVAGRVMRLLAMGLGLDAGKFEELTFSETRVVVGHIYPYCPQPELTLGITPHTDPGIITVLLHNEIPGLQVLIKHDDIDNHGCCDHWVDVEPIHGGLVVNIGDFLQIVSNGEYKSVQHRVLANSAKEPRISVVTFFNLAKWRDFDRYGPLPELLTPEKPAIYRDFTIQEFHENFYNKGLDSKSLVEKIKL